MPPKKKKDLENEKNNSDKLFRHEIKIRYPDNCMEVFIDGNLTTPECTTGREMLEEEENKQPWMPNISINLS